MRSEPTLQSALAAASSLPHYNTDTITLLSHRRYAHVMHELPPALNLNDNTTTELNAMIDAHLAWQEDIVERPTSKGTLLVDWDGSGDPVVSYRKVEAETPEEEVENEQDDIVVQESTEEEDEWFMRTLIPSPLRSVASMYLPSSPMRRDFASMPSSPFYNESFASMPASPAATEPIIRTSFDRARSRLNTHKALPLLPGQRELPIAEECAEWYERSFSEPGCAYIGISGCALERSTSHCSHPQHTSLESIVEEIHAVPRGYNAVDVEEWVERSTEKREERNSKRRDRRETKRKLLLTLDKEWSGVKRVLKKMF